MKGRLENILRSRPKQTWLLSSLLILSLALYLSGITFLFFITIVIYTILTFPFPKILNSFFSRFIASVVIFYGLFQLLASLVFLIFPNSDFFKVIASSSVLIMMSAAFILKRKKPTIPFITKTDLFGIGASLFFILPIMVFAYTKSSLFHISSIGSIQGIDGANHASYLAERSSDQKLDYAKGRYYPAGFHLTTSFIQESVGIEEGITSWPISAREYIAQYLIFAFLLTFLLFLFIKQLAQEVLRYRLNNFILSVSLGVPLSVFYLTPFLYNGFLNYYYILASMVCSFIYLNEYLLAKHKASSENDGEEDFLLPNKDLIHIFMAILLIFGATSSWPLFAPPLIASVVLSLLPYQSRKLSAINTYRSKKFLLMCVALLLLTIPVAIQLLFATNEAISDTNIIKDPGTGINAIGALKTFHITLFTISFITFLGYLIWNKPNKLFSEVINVTLTPLYLFITVAAAYQLFTVGEVRYYVIKVAAWLEILLLALVIVALSKWHSNIASRCGYLLIIIAAPTVLFFGLISINENPLKDVRSQFRAYSSESKPDYFDHDVRLFTQLGTENKIDSFNSTLLHYQVSSGKFFAHMQIPFWANTIQYGAANFSEMRARVCNQELYNNLLFGTFTAPEQAKLITKLKDCASIAKNNHRTYYVVTDETSAPYVKALFQDEDNVSLLW